MKNTYNIAWQACNVHIVCTQYVWINNALITWKWWDFLQLMSISIVEFFSLLEFFSTFFHFFTSTNFYLWENWIKNTVLCLISMRYIGWLIKHAVCVICLFIPSFETKFCCTMVSIWMKWSEWPDKIKLSTMNVLKPTWY